MTYILVRHKVKDFRKWKAIFDEHALTRKSNGSKGGLLMRNANDKNEVVILLEWDSLPCARKFAESKDLKKVMMKAGVVGKPDVCFLNQTEEHSF